MSITSKTIFEPRFILVETSHPGNVGASARAIKTMGLTHLSLVAPRFNDVLTQPDAIAFASGAQDVLKQTKIFTSLNEALADTQIAVAVSARKRTFSPPVYTPKTFLETYYHTPNKIAFIFGSERFGLSNEIIQSCQAIIHIPSSPLHPSLNLAQAVQIIAYECRLCQLTHIVQKQSNLGLTGQLASTQSIEAMFDHLEKTLIAIDFLNPNMPKKLMSRLRRLLTRTSLEVEEVNILRGICKNIEKQIKR